MEVFTHAVLGATLARATTPLGTSGLSMRRRLTIGGLAATFPDLDFASFPIHPLRFLADWHQGPTHSLVLLPLWAVLIGAIFTLAGGRQRAFPQATGVAALGLASHVASDLITAYGTALFHPLSPLRMSFAVTYVIDPLFTIIVLTGLVASLASGKRAFAGLALGVLGLYVGFQASLQQRAIELARASAHTQGLGFERIAALPQPLSPFNWKLIAIDGPRYHEAYVNLAGGSAAVALPGRWGDIAAAYRAPTELAWRTRNRLGDRTELHETVERRWHDSAFAAYRRFATFPAVSRIDDNGELCIWFTDLRYDLPALPDTFRYGFCRPAPERPWTLYRLRYFTERSRQALPSAP